MGVYTSYDERRDRLRDNLNDCLREAKELVMAEDEWGYEDMKDGYAMEVYQAVKAARDAV